MCRIAIAALTSAGPNYDAAIRALGADPVAVDREDISVDEFDGLLIPGGGDIDPSYFGEPNLGSTDIDIEEDRFQLKMIDSFVKAGKPVLGICRGMQVINVYFGGTLIQDIDTRALHYGYKDANGSSCDQIHTVRAEENSWIYQLYGREFPVNSYHHQAVGRLGKDLIQILTSDKDNIVEGYVHKSLPVYGMQWHPERTCLAKARPDAVDGIHVYRYFVEKCRQQR